MSIGPFLKILKVWVGFILFWFLVFFTSFTEKWVSGAFHAVMLEVENSYHYF